jgi:prepilin-type N-terminal cleavage/methylation domain-containing protein
MRRNERGFTLVEILVVIGVFGVILGLGTRFLFLAQEHQRDRDVRDRLDRAAGNILETMRADFAAVPSSVLAQSTLRGQDATVAAPEPFPGVEFSDDRLILPVQSHLQTGQTGLVAYYIHREADRSVLMRQSGKLGETEPSGPQEVVDRLAEAQQFEAAFLNSNGQWLEQWPPEGEASNPRAVRITLGLADPADPGAQVSREAVFRIYPQ